MGAREQEVREGALRSLYASHREAGSSHLGEKMSGPHLFAFHGLLSAEAQESEDTGLRPGSVLSVKH